MSNRVIVLNTLLLAAALAGGSTALAQTAERGCIELKTVAEIQEAYVDDRGNAATRLVPAAKVVPGDKVYDLGAGDGKIVIAAAKRFGATGVGIEYDADLVKHARCLAAAERVGGRVTFIQGDVFETDFGDATVVTLYLLPELNLRLRPTLLAMKPGTRVVSHAFSMDDWQADMVDSADGRTAYMWIVPAKVAGTWKIEMTGSPARSYEAQFTQQFQNIGGSAKADGTM